jgi:hypothetical protein
MDLIQRPPAAKALFRALDKELRFAMRCEGLTYEQAAQVLRDKIAVLDRLREAGGDPTKYPFGGIRG